MAEQVRCRSCGQLRRWSRRGLCHSCYRSLDLGHDIDVSPLGEWATLAACRDADPTLFFPEKNDSHVPDLAKRICDVCEVTDACLAYALDNDQRDGVWGGLSARERATLGQVAS